MKKLTRMRTLSMLLAVVALVFGLVAQQSDVSAASLSTDVSMVISPSLSGSAGLLTATASGKKVLAFTLANGTGAEQGDKIYTATAQITTAGTLSLDLNGGGLVDPFGGAFNVARLKLIYIASSKTNTTALTVLGTANAVPILNTAATTLTLGPGDVFAISRRAAAGIVVTAGTGDILQIVNAAGATANVDIILVGAST
jgi:hypothetical protein